MDLKHFIKTDITNIGDPFVLRFADTYYMYATSFIDGFNVWSSTDLQNWSKPTQAYKAGERSFGYTDFWAPEVVQRYDGKFVMHYSARSSKDDTLHIGVAVADSPLGPFVDVYDKSPMFDFGYATIDGHVLIDGDKRWFYYSRDCSQYVYQGRRESHIYVVELDETLTKTVSQPTLIVHPEQDWEKVTGDCRWNEGPFVIKQDGLYYLMYSSGFYASSTYSTGYAVSKSPLGPFVKATENPILKSVKGQLSGPGHNSVVTDENGKMYCVFHEHTFEDKPSENRRMCICPMRIENGRIIV